MACCPGTINVHGPIKNVEATCWALTCKSPYFVGSQLSFLGDNHLKIRRTRSISLLLLQQLPQHVRQHPAVADIFDVLGRIDARNHVEFLHLAVFFGAHL